MLPKGHRLRRSSDFNRVRRGGRSASSPLVTLYVLPTRALETRVGFSVSKRVGKATTRNKVKRRLREIVRSHLVDIGMGQDLVFIARPLAANVDFARLEAATENVLYKSGAMRPRVQKAVNA